MAPDASLSEPPAKKRRRIATKASKSFKKDFDSPPSILLDHPPLLKCMPFSLMVADWWLKSHPGTKILDSAGWLMGFHGCLKEDDLHPIDREYLKELVMWHEEKQKLN